MKRDTGVVVLAAQKSDDAFWSIEPLVHLTGAQVLAVFSENDLFEGLSTRSLRPSVIMLSAALTERPVSETISQIRKVDQDILVVVVTANSTEELERGARRAGIFYYMTLPAHCDEVRQVMLWGLGRSGNCKSNGKGGESE